MKELIIAIFSLGLGIYNVYNFYKKDKENEAGLLYEEKNKAKA